MSDGARINDHGEVVLDEQLAASLARKGFDARPGDRVRFEVLDGMEADSFVPLSKRPGWPPPWVAGFDGPSDLAATAKERLWGTDQTAS